MSPTSMATARFMETWAHGARRRRGAGRRRPSRPTGSGTSPTSACAPATSPSACTALEPPAEEFRIELRSPVGRAVGVGSGRGRADGARLGVRLLPAGDPAPPPRRPRPGRRPARRRPLARPRPGLRRPARARDGPLAGRAASVSELDRSRLLRVGNCSGFYGDRLSAMRELLEGGDARRRHRRLPRRADHADPGQGPAQGPVARLRAHVRQRRSPTASPWRWSRACGSSPTPAASTPPGWSQKLREVAEEQGLSPRIAWVDGDNLAPRAAELGLRRRAHRQRLPRRLRHRPGARGRAPTSWSPGGSPTPPSSSARRSGGSAGPPRAVRRAGRRRRRGPRHRVRHPGDRRQLLRLPRPAARRPAARLPGRGDRGRRQQRDHQARRHRRPGLGRHRHRAADVRGAVRALPRPRRDRRPDHASS